LGRFLLLLVLLLVPLLVNLDSERAPRKLLRFVEEDMDGWRECAQLRTVLAVEVESETTRHMHAVSALLDSRRMTALTSKRTDRTRC